MKKEIIKKKSDKNILKQAKKTESKEKTAKKSKVTTNGLKCN